MLATHKLLCPPTFRATAHDFVGEFSFAETYKDVVNSWWIENCVENVNPHEQGNASNGFVYNSFRTIVCAGLSQQSTSHER